MEKKNNLQKVAQFPVSFAWLLLPPRERFEFVLKVQDCTSIKVQKTSNKAKKAEFKCSAPFMRLTELCCELCSLPWGGRDVRAQPVTLQRGWCRGMQLGDFNVHTSMLASCAPPSTNTQGEVLTKIGRKFFPFMLPNLIIHNPLASPQLALLSLAAGKCCLISRLNFSRLGFPAFLLGSILQGQKAFDSQDSSPCTYS